MSGDEIQEHEPSALYFDQRQNLHFFRDINGQVTQIYQISQYANILCSATNLFSPTKGVVQLFNLTNIFISCS